MATLRLVVVSDTHGRHDGWVVPDGDVLVADSVNHALRRVRLSDGAVSTVAGNGAQLRECDEGPRSRHHEDDDQRAQIRQARADREQDEKQRL
jgi:hypothetical protein